MKAVKHIVVIIFAISVGLFGAGDVKAHPGNTASDGCHYCRTNCDTWGVPWNQRHCHGGVTVPQPASPPYNPPPSPKPSPVATKEPDPSPFPTPIPTPTPSPTPSPSPTPENSPTPEVKGESTQASPSPETTVIGGDKEEASTGDAILGFGIFAGFIGSLFWMGRSLFRRFRSN